MIHETFDDEVVIVDLESGVYYSTDAIAADIWSMILAGSSFEELVEALLTRYTGEPALIQSHTVAFLDRLLAARLIEPTDGPSAGTAALGESGLPRRVFSEPRLEPYTDMQDLLLLDPIHEVDETGWPAAAVEREPAKTGDGT